MHISIQIIPINSNKYPNNNSNNNNINNNKESSNILSNINFSYFRKLDGKNMMCSSVDNSNIDNHCYGKMEMIKMVEQINQKL